MDANGFPLHATMQKNWDHYELISLLDELPKSAAILDMGSGHGFTLKLLFQLGFKNIRGIDFERPRIPRFDYLKQIFKKSFSPYALIKKGDLCNTGFMPASFDFLTCISVIEHGIDIDSFLKEASRLLVPGGGLWVTFDYWESVAGDQSENITIFGLPWTIFDRGRADQLIKTASRYGLVMQDPDALIPACREKTVHYASKQYTFMGIMFEKTLL